MSAPSFAPASWRGAHSRAIQQPRSKARSSVRFDWTHCRPYAAGCCAVAAFWLGANAELSFKVGDNAGLILWGVLTSVSAGFAVYFGLRSVWPDLEAEREAAEARALAEMEERTRRFAQAADRMRYLKAERIKRRARKKSCADIDAELALLNRAMLAGTL